jgi:hypothetical protein
MPPLGGRPGHQRGGMVPVGPFRAWLEELHKHHAEQEVARMLGSDERRIYRWRNEGGWIALDNVDACLCHAGLPRLLNELYPACECHGAVECPDAVDVAA